MITAVESGTDPIVALGVLVLGSRACDDGRSGQDGKGKGVKVQELHVDFGCLALELWGRSKVMVGGIEIQRETVQVYELMMSELLKEIEKGGSGSSFIDERWEAV